MVGIYKIISPTGKVYIGQSWDVEKRQENYRRLACKAQTKLYNSLKKYGFAAHSFEVLVELPSDTTQNVLDNYEVFCWEQYRYAKVELLNSKEPGSKGKQSQETIAKIKHSKAKRPYRHSESIKDHLRKVSLGRKDSLESRLSKRNAHLGIKHERVKCPYCNIVGGIRCMKRWHFDKCKLK